MFARLTKSLRQRQDLVLVFLMIMTIMLMILPMPTLLIDLLIGINLSLTILILSVSIYLRRPEMFSTFPGIILVATAFRLAISISTTRLILVQADAGEVIETFGTFVTAGNVIVGIVIFLIITSVQFLVITKGSERVAEVAARFVLDALPGRQMSIDAEVRAGDIKPDEARRRRRQLDRENQFYGAMDGAMKFVKGDAIAGLIIIAVNLLGGIGVGMVQRGMSVGEAIDVYSRLTIGDGLVSQIPALLMALCAGTVITRVNTDEQSDLGTDMFRQLVSNPRTLWISAFVVGLMGLVPGFPKPIFFALGLGLGLMAWSLNRQQQAQAEAEAERDAPRQQAGQPESAPPTRPGETPKQPAAAIAPEPNDLALIRLGAALHAQIDPIMFAQTRQQQAERYQAQTGLSAPTYGVARDESLGARAFSIDLEGVPVFSAEVPAGALLLEGNVETAELAGFTLTPAGPDWPPGPAAWAEIPSDSGPAIARAEAAGLGVYRTEQIVVTLTLYHVKKNIGHILGYRDMQRLMAQVEQNSPEIAAQIAQTVTPARTMDILRRLAEEGVSLSARRPLFEAIAELGGQDMENDLLVEQIRRVLRRQICHGLADANRVIAAYIVEPDLEQGVRAALRQTQTGTYLMMPPALGATFLSQVEQIAERARKTGQPAILVTAPDLRRHVRTYIVEQGLQASVLAFSEIAPEFHLQPIGTLNDAQTPMAAE